MQKYDNFKCALSSLISLIHVIDTEVNGLECNVLLSACLLGSVLNVHVKLEKLRLSRHAVGISTCLQKSVFLTFSFSEELWIKVHLKV